MTIILEIKEAHLAFIDNGGLGFLSRHLHTSDKDPNDLPRKAGASVQQLYELTYCLWLLSFDCCDHHSPRKHFRRDGAVPALVDLVAAATREKITRLALSTLRNLATFHTSEDSYDALAFRTEMIGCGLLTRLERLKEAAKWNDPDMIDDVDILEEHLQETFRHMTRWDLYHAEVESSHLQWGVLHTKKFFRENIKLFEGDDGQFKIIHDLVRLTASADEEVASIACYDLGEFVRHYPNGRLLASRLGARDAVMALIDHSHEELQKQALLAVSKMLIQNWKAVE
jgi:V-type H+-transporting ATPase subunit H